MNADSKKITRFICQDPTYELQYTAALRLQEAVKEALMEIPPQYAEKVFCDPKVLAKSKELEQEQINAKHVRAISVEINYN